MTMPPPDTYEEDLAKAQKARYTPAPWAPGRVKAARLDELERTAKIFLGNAEAYWPQWGKHIIGERRKAIARGEV